MLMEVRVAWRMVLAAAIAVSLAACGCVPPVGVEGEGSSGTVWVVVFLAAVWAVILAAILITVFRIRRREKREEEEGVEFTSKEH